MKDRSPRALAHRFFAVAIAVALAFALTACPQQPPPETLGTFELSLPTSAVEGEPFTLTVTAVGTEGSAPFQPFQGAVTLTLPDGSGVITPTTLALTMGAGTITNATVTGITGTVTIRASANGKRGDAALEIIATAKPDPDDPPPDDSERLNAFVLTAPDSVAEGEPFALTVTAVGSEGTTPFVAFSDTITMTIGGADGAQDPAASAGVLAPSTLQASGGVATTSAATVSGVTGVVTIIASADGVNGTTTVLVTTSDEDAPLRKLPGDAAESVSAVIPERSFTARPDDYSADNPDLPGVLTSFNTMLLAFTIDTNVAEANEILTAMDAEIVGGVPGISGDVPGILFVRVPTMTHEAMNDLIDRMREDDRIEYVVQDSLLEASIVPAPNDGSPEGWVWTLEPGGANWGLEFVRAPQLWNLNDAVARSGQRTVTAVFDTGFIDAHDDLVYVENLTPGTEHDHGTHVAGTIGALFDNGIGVDGINPFADLVVSAITIPPRDPDPDLDWVLGERQSFGEGFLTGFRDTVMSRADIQVVNISMGYNWACAGINQGEHAGAQEMVRQHGGLFRTLLILLSRERELPLIVAAAGNDSGPKDPRRCRAPEGFGRQQARWASPFNYAGLVLDPPDVFGVSPIIVVEAIQLGWGGVGDRTAFSNLGGTISAPGFRIWSTSLDRFDTSRSDFYEEMSGTSMAAPHVSGLIGYLLAVDPDLSHAQIRELLVRNGIAVGGGASDHIDAYGTVLDIDRVRMSDAVRGRLLDVTGSGHFGEQDLLLFLQAFADGQPDEPIHSRFDLNGDGLTGGDSTAWFDLNRDGQLGSITFAVEGEVVTLDQAALTDLEILCFYAYSPLYLGDHSTRSLHLAERCAPDASQPDEPISLEVEVNLPDPGEGDIGADVMFNVDLSGSYGPDLATFRNRATDIVDALTANISDVRFGISSFVDAPCSSFGAAGSGDYGHRLDLPLTYNLGEIQSTLDGLNIYFGRDGPESQLESMYQTMTGAGYVVNQGTVCDGVADIDPSTPGWTVDRIRFLLHATDAPFHRPGDVGSDGVPYPYPRTDLDVIRTAQITGTRIFFLDSGGGTDEAKHSIADSTGGQVFLLSSDSAEVVEAVFEAAAGAVRTATISLVPSGADASFVSSIAPVSYTNVDLTTTTSLSFTVTFVDSVQPGPVPQEFRFFLTVDGALFDDTPVVIVVPAQP